MATVVFIVVVAAAVALVVCSVFSVSSAVAAARHMWQQHDARAAVCQLCE